jgi:ABC-2 type transport system permease protein
VTNSAAPPAIEVRDLVKRYAKSKTNAVDGVSFEVRRGEIFALLGPNGAGKTTTIGVLTTAVLPTSGATRIMGIDVVADAREIDDRLLAPLPIPLVAVEKVLFAAIRGVIAGSVIFPLAWWILGDRFSVRTDRIAMMAGMIVLTACVGAGIGLVMGTSIKPEQISLWFTVIFTPPLFTGCTYYPWGTLTNIRWFQVVVLFNPLTYASEGLRHTMVPAKVGVPTLNIGIVVAALGASVIGSLILGTRTFRGRVVS